MARKQQLNPYTAASEAAGNIAGAYGPESDGSVLGTAAQYGLQGAAFSPVGAAVGAVVGLGIGLLKKRSSRRARRRAEEEARRRLAKQTTQRLLGFKKRAKEQRDLSLRELNLQLGGLSDIVEKESMKFGQLEALSNDGVEIETNQRRSAAFAGGAIGTQQALLERADQAVSAIDKIRMAASDAASDIESKQSIDVSSYEAFKQLNEELYG